MSQAFPGVHATQVPVPLQTPPVQGVVFGVGVAVSTHCRVPVAQDHVPTTQGFGLVAHVPPAAHAVQAPALQT